MNMITSTWLEQLAIALPGNPVGEDPRYNEEFIVVKQQIEKLSGTDYPLVLQHCKKILAEQTKDLRVAGYLALAATYVNGVLGLTESLRAYQILITHFWQQLHPKRSEAKLAALKWLNNPRLIAFIGEKEVTSQEQIDALSQTIQELNQAIKIYVGENIPILASLEVWISKQQKLLGNNSVMLKPEKLISDAASFSVSLQKKLNSAAEVDALCLEIIRYYQQQNALLPAAAYARALRWSGMKLPPHENYQTRIPALRASGLLQLQHALRQGDPKAIYEQCEALFLEPGAHVLLDLQYHACAAAKAMEQDDLARYLEAEVVALLKRMPLLMELQYSDQKYFADVDTRVWLNELLSLEEFSESVRQEKDLEIENFIVEAKRHTKRKKFTELLNYISNMHTATAKDEFQKKRALAKICLENKRHDLAIPVLENLADIILKHQLAQWEPQLALSTWVELHQALTLQLKKSSDNLKLTLLARIAQIKDIICQIDITHASMLF